MAGSRDPYQTLGVSPNAPDDEVRSAYRRLVKQYHPDHNGGSEASEQRFEEVQEAYARIRELRKGRTTGAASSSPPPRRAGQQAPPPRPPFDPDVEARMARLEQELRQAHEARERARRAAAEAAQAAAGYKRPTDEELGYVTTDDSFSKIISDARSELSEKLSGAREGAREHPVAQRVSNLIDELEDLLSKTTRDRHE